MKFIFLFLFLIISSSVNSDQSHFKNARLAMGFYYPALKNVSSKTDIEISLNYWMKELTNKINLTNSYAVLFEDSNKMHTAFRNGELDMVIAPPLLLAINFDRELLSNAFMGIKQKGKIDQLLIIAQQSKDQKPISFIGKRLLLPSDDLLAKLFIETEALQHYHLPLQQVFATINLRKKTHKIVLDLFFDKADVAVVYDKTFDLMIEMNPQIKNKITILKKFPVKSKSFAFFHRDYLLKEQLREEAKKFDSEPRGKQILEVFRMTDIAPSDVKDLTTFDDFYRTYLQLKKQYTAQ